MYAAEAIECLAKEMREGDTSGARIAAAKVLLEHGIPNALKSRGFQGASDGRAAVTRALRATCT
jgi:hypothetical protein